MGFRSSTAITERSGIAGQGNKNAARHRQMRYYFDLGRAPANCKQCSPSNIALSTNTIIMETLRTSQVIETGALQLLADLDNGLLRLSLNRPEARHIKTRERKD